MLKRNVIVGLPRYILNKSTIILLAFLLCGTVGVAQKTYTVKKGETVFGIAKRQQVLLDSLLKWNEIKIVEEKNEKGEIIKKEKPPIREGQNLIVESTSTKKAENSEPKKSQTGTEKEQTEKQNAKTDNVVPTTEGGKTSGTAASATKCSRDGKSKTEGQPTQKTSSWWWFWLILGLGGGVFVWEKFLREKLMSLINRNETKSSEEYIKQLQTDKKELKNEIDALNKKIKTLEKQNKEFLEENIAMGQKIEGYEYKPKQSFIADANNSQGIAGQARNDGSKETRDDGNKEVHNNGQNIEHSNSSTLYADSTFSSVTAVPNADTIFELHLRNAQTASFTVYSGAKELVAQRPEFIDDTYCEKQVSGNSAVQIVNEGKVQKDNSGSWKIISNQKLNVIIK